MPASTDRYTRLNASIRDSIENPKDSNALMRCMERGREKRTEMLAQIEGGAAFRDDVRLVKERCIEEQDALLQRFVENCEKRGTTVFIAKDGAAAIEYVLNLAKERGAETIAKSKSLTTEEIEINDPLIEAGLRVVETDLGELIIQLVNEKPFHLVFPSVHKMTKDVAEIFAKETGENVEPNIPAIMKVVRAYLRPIFLSADIAQRIVADSTGDDDMTDEQFAEHMAVLNSTFTQLRYIRGGARPGGGSYGTHGVHQIRQDTKAMVTLLSRIAAGDGDLDPGTAKALAEIAADVDELSDHLGVPDDEG